ncbi:MAG: hypothetical protein Q9166_005522 [cf. Caloplaca sp. 2 TL-2023]
MHVYKRVLSPAIALSLFPAFGLSGSTGETVIGNAATALKPISINDFEAATGVHRRAAEDFSHLDPSTQAQLIYGRPGNDGQLLLANMTLYAPDGLQIVMMERFEPLTSAVDCKGDDGEMSLTFKSQEACDYAINTWSFINQDEDEQFLLIANHDGCGPDDERQPYRITDIREDKAHLTTYLTALPAPWSEIASTYDLDFGKAAMSQPKPRRRDLLSGIGNFFGDAGDFFLHGDIDFDKSVNFPVSIGTPGERHSIVDISKFQLACIDCYVTGSFQVVGHLSVSGFKLQDFTLAGSPQDFAAKLEFETTITAPLGSLDALQYNKTLFSAPIPNAGISVTGIFSLGAIVSYEIGVSTSFSGSASMTFGLSASLPNTAMAIADVRHPSQSAATGFDGGQIDPSFNLTALSASVSVAAFAQPKLSFGIDITKVGHLEIALGVKSPVVGATLTGGYNESGLCSTEPGASKTGVELSSEVALEVNLELDAQLGEDIEAPSLALNLFRISHPLLDKCFPLSLPGFSPVPGNTNSTLPPYLNTTLPLPSNSTVIAPVGNNTNATLPTTLPSNSTVIALVGNNTNATLPTTLPSANIATSVAVTSIAVDTLLPITTLLPTTTATGVKTAATGAAEKR